LPARKALAARKTLVRQKELNWWDLLWSRSWQKARNPKIVSKYFGGQHSFAFDTTGDFVVVVGHAWLMKKGQLELEGMDEGAYEITDREFYLAALAYLNSAAAYDLMQYLSPQVAGGQLDLSNKYLGALPVLNFANLAPDSSAKLIEAGTRIATAESFDRWAEVDELALAVLSE
jgi:hypothetical protein